MVPRIRTLLRVFGLVVVAASAALPSESAPLPYLALGDSVVLGFINHAGYEYGNPVNFIGFPDYVGRALRLDDTNAACPGETTTSFLSATAADNGCRLFRSLAPLHVSYPPAQSDFALAFLAPHRHTQLVTILLGADDVFLLETACRGIGRASPTACPRFWLPSVRIRRPSSMRSVVRGSGESSWS